MNEMNEKMSFKMGVQFSVSFKMGEKVAASFYMGKNFLDIWHVF